MRRVQVEDDSQPLNEKESDLFHRTTARLLFAAKRARPDLQVAVAYLCTGVKSSNRSDYRKLTRVVNRIPVIRYFGDTRYIFFIFY
jgi:hypothetical protein